MALIRVSIKDKSTLELLEDGNKGDLIDLNALSAADVATVSDAVRLAARQEIEAEIETFRLKELEAELLKKEKELNEKHQSELTALEMQRFKMELASQKKDEEIAKLLELKEESLRNERQERLLELERLSMEKENAIISLKAELEKKSNAIMLEMERKEREISSLSEQLKVSETQKALEIERTIQAINNEKLRLENALDLKEKDYQLSERTLKERYEDLLKRKDDEIKQHRDFKLKQSTKMLGETLERHCDIAFESIRGFLGTAVEYGKDTIAAEGSMGDRIYREFDENGTEILSIMFEMKNEADTTATKQRNEHFFKELDKDRNLKRCEYAVLVSLLEKENEIYDGIYTVPESKYRDMFVIRPQHFTQIIMWLRNVSKKLASSKKALIAFKEQDRDYTNFDEQAAFVRDKFNKHYSQAMSKHNNAIDEIDKMIRGLEKIKEELKGSDKQLRLASEDLEGLTVKKLAKNSPSILDELGIATKKKKV